MTNIQKVVNLIVVGGRLIKEQVEQASNILNRSGVIAVPTDTLYGIAAKVDDSAALERIYRIKGRDKCKPLAVCVADVDLIPSVAEIGNVPPALFASLLPGQITVVLKRSANLNKDLNPGIDTVGVRVPNHFFITAICDQIGPIALTSANKSGGPDSVLIQEFEDIWDDLDCVFDQGPLQTEQMRMGSTVLDLTSQDKRVYNIIREGRSLNRVINTMTRFGYLRKPTPTA